MKTMHNYLLLSATVAMLCLASMVKAQSNNAQPREPEQVAETQTRFLNQKLNLDSMQYQQLYEVNLKYVPKMQALKAIESSKKKVKQYRTLNEAKDTEVKAILTKDQYQEYLAMKQEMQEMMRQKRKEQE